MGALTLETAPGIEPIPVSDAKEHMRVDVTIDDTLIAGLLLAAKRKIEDLTARRLITQSWKWTLDDFPEGDTILLPLAPVSSVTSIKTTDRNGVVATFDASNYIVDTVSEPARIKLKEGVIFPLPVDQLQEINGVEIIFVVGYGVAATDVPEELLLAIKMLTGHYYENREDTTPITIREVPSGVKSLIAHYYAWNKFHHVEISPDAKSWKTS